MKARFVAPWRAAAGRALLLGVCLVALLVSPAAARPSAARSAPVPDGPLPPAHRLFLPMTALPGHIPTSFDLIDAALAKGTIDSETALVYKVWATFGDARLPSQYRGADRHVYGGTQVMIEAVTRYPTLTPATQAILVPFLLPAYYKGSWEDQLAHQGGGGAANAVSEGARAFTFAAAPAVDAPSDKPPRAVLSDGWHWKGNDKVKVWGRNDHPDDDRKMDLILNEMTNTIWPKLTSLMGREPFSDAEFDNNGGDARFDIALATLADYGLTYPYTTGRYDAAFIYVNTDVSDADLKGSVAHEFMHAIQFTYPMHAGDQYTWMMEATATWAEDYVYPKLNTEQLYLSHFLDYWRDPLDGDHGPHMYGAYLFPFYLTHRYSPDLVRKMWEATVEKDSLGAIDSVIEGGFKQQWPEFARYDWNHPPQDDYTRWDAVPRGVGVPDTVVALRGRKDVDLPLPGQISHLAAQYAHYVFTDDSARSIAFTNPYFNFANPNAPDPAVKVQAVAKIGGQWGQVQDLTTKRGMSFCRDMKAERVEELLVVISNSSTDPAHVLKQVPHLVATNIGCWRWSGISTATYTTKGFWTMTTQANVTFERKRYTADVSLNSEYYVPVSGNWVWSLDGTNGDCVYHGGPTTGAITELNGTLQIVNYGTSGAYYRTYNGSGHETETVDYTVTCPDSTRTNHWSGAGWFLTNQEHVTVSDDGTTLDAEVVAQDNAQFYEKYVWHLTAQREP